MKSADEVSRALVDKFSGMTFSGGLGSEWLVSEIAQALTAYANEALEEASQMAESCRTGLGAATNILALKEKR